MNIAPLVPIQGPANFCTPDMPLLWREDGLLVELEDIIIFLSGFRREPPSGFPLKPTNSVHSGEPGKGGGVQPHPTTQHI